MHRIMLAALLGLVSMAIPVQVRALTAKECADKYNAAKLSGMLNGRSWNDFRKTDCAAATAPAISTTPGAVVGQTTAGFAADDINTCNSRTGRAAIEACTRIIKARPKGINIAVAYGNRGFAYASIAREFSARYKETHEPTHLEGEVVQFRNAIGDFEASLRNDPSQENIKKAIELSNKQIELVQKQMDLGRQSDQLRNCKNASDADKKIAACTSLIGSAQADDDFLYASYAERAKARIAKRQIDEALSDGAFIVQHWKKLGECTNGGAAGAAVCLLKALSFDENPAIALALLDKAIELAPDSDNKKEFYFQQRGELFVKLGFDDKAIVEYNKAIENRARPSSLYARALVLERRGDVGQALKDLRRAGELPNDNRRDEEARSRALDKLSKLEPKDGAGGGLAAANWRKVALVIGNSTYAHALPLNNPTADAKAVATALRTLGFAEVIERYDLGLQQLSAEMKAFGDKVADADWAVVYYAGHGIEVGGVNYLVPVDASLMRAAHVEDEAVPLDRVLSKVADARKLRLVILDACRRNPFVSRMQVAGATRAIGRGLARIENTGGVLVAYAARDGQVAEDGSGDHSPFTQALIENLETPGLELNLLFRRVRDAVLKRTAGAQEPFTYGSLPSEEFYFRAAQK